MGVGIQGVWSVVVGSIGCVGVCGSLEEVGV